MNLSEGRNTDFLSQLYGKLHSIEGCELAHCDQGFDVNRTVLTIIGTINATLKAVELVISEAQGTLNINEHQGTHPRVGIIDVIPFVPLRNINKTQLMPIINKWAKNVSQKFSIPIIYYGAMATQSNTQTLAQIRKGGLHRLISRIKKNDVHLDYGIPESIYSLGVSCITVRDIMVAYNINLNTNDIQIAKNIAKSLRDLRKNRSVLKDVRFLAWRLDSSKCVQISTNIYDTSAISMVQLYELIQKVAADYQTQLNGSELIGLTTEYAITHNSISIIKAKDILKLNESSSFNLNSRLLDRYLLA